MAQQFVIFLCLACLTWQHVVCNITNVPKGVPGTSFQCVDIKGENLCCPYKDGHFCKDQLSCCPSGTTCDETQTACEQTNTLPIVAWKTESPVPLIQNLTEILTPYSTKPTNCPPVISGGPLYRGSRTFQCPTNTTYCKDAYRFGYTCCPFEKATCCGDYNHCCPEGTQCDLINGLCLSESVSEKPWFRVFRAITRSRRRKPVDVDRQPHPVAYSKFKSCNGPIGRTCPDNSSCSDSATCCSFVDDTFGCCPMSKAVCCSDHLHCCPNGTTCNVAQGTCERGKPTQQVVVRKAKHTGTIDCPGGRSTCPDWTTCCEVGGGKYACCPMTNAVCCSDKRHCCPNGSKCDLANHTCDKGGIKRPLYTKYPACHAASDPFKNTV